MPRDTLGQSPTCISADCFAMETFAGYTFRQIQMLHEH